MEFKNGDVVELKSGGPKMTITRFIGEDKTGPITMQDKAYKMAGYKDGDVICQWFDKNALKSGVFSITNLKMI